MIDMVVCGELQYGSFSSLNDMFGEDNVKRLREAYENDSYQLAIDLKGGLNLEGILAEIITFKNGNAFLDSGIEVNNKKIYYHSVLLMGEVIIDLLNEDRPVKTQDYVKKLQACNPKLRIDHNLSTWWYTEDGYPIQLTIQDLLNYKSSN